jgi:hypothetical protein
MKAVIIALTLTITVAFHSFTLLQSKTVAVFQKLGIPENVAKDCIWSSLSGKYLSYPDVSKLKAVAAGDRGTVVREIAAFAKHYTTTEEFKSQYSEYRNGRKPNPPEPPKSMKELKQDQRESLQKSIRETEANMKQMSGDQQKMMKDVVKMLKDQLKSLDDPNNPMFSPDMDKMQKQGHEMAMASYKEQVAQWEKENPITPTQMIKAWLTEFLEVSRDVDFGATLIEGDGGRMLFAKTEYERKPETWKMCFRAGKSTVDAGRAAAQQWLGELKSAK